MIKFILSFVISWALVFPAFAATPMATPTPGMMATLAGVGSQPPPSGVGYKVGDFWKNSDPSFGESYFWECVTPRGGGTPCVWVAGPQLMGSHNNR